MGAGTTDDKAVQSWTAYKEGCAKVGCQPKHAHYSTEQGKGYCITEADSADMVQKAHDEANVPVDEVVENKDLD